MVWSDDPTKLTIYLPLTAVSDLAPGQSGMDDMKLLEQKAQQIAEEVERERPKPKGKILFVRYVVESGRMHVDVDVASTVGHAGAGWIMWDRQVVGAG